MKKMMFALLVGLMFVLALPSVLADAHGPPPFSGGGEGTEAEPYEVASCEQLQEIQTGGWTSNHFVLVDDIDCSDTQTWNPYNGINLGFEPITNFNGVFDGQGNTISNLYINRENTNNVGLFSHTEYNEDVLIKNVGLVDVNITGQNIVGGLSGVLYMGRIENSFVTGNIQGVSNVGGLVGRHEGALLETIIDSYFIGNINALGDDVGGLVGVNEYDANILNSYAIGTITANGHNVGGLVGRHGLAHNTDYSLINNSWADMDIIASGNRVGGLVGQIQSRGVVNNSYALGNVEGGYRVGGLAGDTITSHEFSGIYNSFALGNVVSTASFANEVGGLVGRNRIEIQNSYAQGNVSGGEIVGGLIGEHREGNIINSYSTGFVDASFTTGGLIGEIGHGETTPQYIDNFYDSETTGQSDTKGAIPMTTEEMKNIATFSAWDIVEIQDFENETWFIDDGNDYPRLFYEFEPLVEPPIEPVETGRVWITIMQIIGGFLLITFFVGMFLFQQSKMNINQMLAMILGLFIGLALIITVMPTLFGM